MHIKGGLYNDFTKISTKGNSEIGVFLEADNVISNNNFTIYSENTASGSTDFWAVDGWTLFGEVHLQTSSNTFTVTGDQTATFPEGRKLKLTDDGVDYYGVVDNSVYTSLTTVTVTLWGASNVLTSNLTAVYTDAGNNNLRDNDFWSVRADGFTAADIYTGNGNANHNGGKYDALQTNAFQPWVYAHPDGDKTNVTGDGTTYSNGS